MGWVRWVVVVLLWLTPLRASAKEPVRIPDDAWIPDGVLDSSVQAVGYSVVGLPWLEHWVRIAVRIPSGSTDDLWLMTAAHPEALAPEAISPPERPGSRWAIFQIPPTSPAQFTLYQGQAAHPFKASPIVFHRENGQTTWRWPRPFQGCSPGRWAAQDVALSLYPEPKSWDPPRCQDEWGAGGGTARWRSGFPCPSPRRTDQVDMLGHVDRSVLKWISFEPQNAPAARFGKWGCALGVIQHEDFDPESGPTIGHTWEWKFGREEPDIPSTVQFPCGGELWQASPKPGRWQAEWTHTAIELRQPVVQAPLTPQPLILPRSSLSGPRIDQRELVAHLHTDSVDVRWEDERPPSNRHWSTCSTEQQRLLTQTYGPLRSCRAANGIVHARYGEGADCPAGCIYHPAVGRIEGGEFVPVSVKTLGWLSARQEDVLGALLTQQTRAAGTFANLGLTGHRLSIWCRIQKYVEPDGQIPGQVGQTTFDGTEECLLSRMASAVADARGRDRRYGVLMGLVITGTVRVLDDGSIDTAELTFTPTSLEYNEWTDIKRNHRRVEVSRRVVLARTSPPPPGPRCRHPDAERWIFPLTGVCGGSRRPMMFGTIGRDGRVAELEFLGWTPENRRWKRCVRDSMMAKKYTEGNCFALPIIP